jgi:dTDP-4-amino-4,6-dideoxygalactose transaminase
MRNYGQHNALLAGDRVARFDVVVTIDDDQFLRGEVDKYSWVDVGSSYVLSYLLVALLWSQFEPADRIQARRRAIWDRYHTELRDWSAPTGATLPRVPDDAEQAYHLFYLLLPFFNDLADDDQSPIIDIVLSVDHG